MLYSLEVAGANKGEKNRLTIPIADRYEQKSGVPRSTVLYILARTYWITSLELHWYKF